VTPGALLLTGTVGVGKTAVAEAIGDLLRDAGVPKAVVDVDWLRAAWPPPPGDPFNRAMALRNLAAVGANYLDAGAVRLVLAGVVETPEDREAHAAALGVPLTVVRLVADPDVVRARLLRRHDQDDDARRWHLHRAGELHAIQEDSAVEDHRVDTSSRTVPETAAAVLASVGWAAPSS
jgi:predicted kinase